MKLFYSDVFELPLPEGHRFPMSKYRLLRERIATHLVQKGCELHLPPAATDEELTLVHTATYVEQIKNGDLSDLEQRRIGFPWSEKMVERSRRSTGATIAAGMSALGEGIAINLAGGTHHSFAERGQGYCVFNDSCVAAKVLQSRLNVGRVMIVDCDVHQGNGTAAISREDETLFSFSMQCADNFPFEKTAGDVDVNLPPRANDQVYLTALKTELTKAFSSFEPDLVFYLAGADPYKGDRLGKLDVTKQGLRQRDQWVIDFCRNQEIPISISMAGGYASDVEEIVDIHFATVEIALARFHRDRIHVA